jgi:hypothetical protein
MPTAMVATRPSLMVRSKTSAVYVEVGGTRSHHSSAALEERQLLSALRVSLFALDYCKASFLLSIPSHA